METLRLVLNRNPLFPRRRLCDLQNFLRALSETPSRGSCQHPGYSGGYLYLGSIGTETKIVYLEREKANVEL